MTNKLGTESYKGVRDFYPEDLAIQKHIFDTMRKTVESFGYVEYSASLLEPTELYTSKTSDEIVNDQTYTFIDRGERSVTLRPEMTPTVARMVAAKKRELAFPLRWYSIPNVFRYEKPQRGRLREHWQLNVDLFGSESLSADTEMIRLSHALMKAFGAKDNDFEIRINSRSLLQEEFKRLELSPEKEKSLRMLLDKRNKMTSEAFSVEINTIVGRPYEFNMAPSAEINKVLESLKGSGITNAVFDPNIIRGFDYYTGIVFEVFDTNSENKRSLFGGGRYDNLAELFTTDKIPAIGFGAGDVTIRDFLESRDLLPEYVNPTQIFIATINPEHIQKAELVAEKMRALGLNVEINLTDKKVGDQIKLADKKGIPYVLFIGDESFEDGMTVRNLSTGAEEKITAKNLPEFRAQFKR